MTPLSLAGDPSTMPRFVTARLVELSVVSYLALASCCQIKFNSQRLLWGCCDMDSSLVIRTLDLSPWPQPQREGSC
jgi:hypothetical protein